ncbi:hypothetical protein RF11_02304 [Thelohanellus kitauei]|uniref:Uncharacterized protein n=1 Tax=Thelohanellus kitauei TaxID=669202 RepID=A0A0C2N0V9_THEKT|nr:hypothetical protein RF11_02304 [Thelohanellus kitauei]
MVTVVSSLELTNEPYDPFDARNHFYLHLALSTRQKGSVCLVGTPIKINQIAVLCEVYIAMYFSLSNFVTTREDSETNKIGTLVDSENISNDEKYCQLFCREFDSFPISFQEEISDADLAKFCVHLKFMKSTTTDPSNVMKSCNDATKAHCMEDLLKQEKPDPNPILLPTPVIPTDPVVPPTPPPPKSEDGSKNWIWITIVVSVPLSLTLIILGIFFFQQRCVFANIQKKENM